MPEHHATQIASIAKSIGTGAHAIWVEEKLRQSTSELEVGDFILELDDQPVGRMADIRHLSRAEFTKALVLRERKEKEVVIKSKPSSLQRPPRVICWGGALLQVTPKVALEQTTPEFAHAAEREGIEDLEALIYICSRLLGSPASETPGLPSGHWILEINKQKVTSLEALLDIIATLRGINEEEEYIRVKLLGEKGITSIVGIKLNSHFWPLWSLERKRKQWVRTELE